MQTERRRTPVYQSLLEVKTVAGVESRIAILNGTFAAAFTFGLDNPWMIPIAVVTHIFLRWLTKKDPHIIRIYSQYRVLGAIYDPWPKRKQRTNARPRGFGRGLLC